MDCGSGHCDHSGGGIADDGWHEWCKIRFYHRVSAGLCGDILFLQISKRSGGTGKEGSVSACCRGSCVYFL